jgi:hypothetical protein
MKSAPELLKKIGRILWYGRSYFSFLDFPIPCRLPYGCWFLARGDETGLLYFSKYHMKKMNGVSLKNFLSQE